MQSAVAPISVRDLRGGPLGVCSTPRGMHSLHVTSADLCRSFAFRADLGRSLAADKLAKLTFCESLRILAMRRSTRNSQDAGLFPAVALAVLPDVSVQSSQPATSAIPAIASVASPLTAAQLSPDCLAAIVQAVRASIVAEAPGSLSQSSPLPASVAVVRSSCSSLPVLGGVPGQDLGAQALSLLASGTGFSLQSPLASASSSQGRPAFVVPSFVSTFAPPNSFTCVVSGVSSCHFFPSVRCADIFRF